MVGPWQPAPGSVDRPEPAELGRRPDPQEVLSAELAALHQWQLNSAPSGKQEDAYQER